jgi:hypothetical protein
MLRKKSQGTRRAPALKILIVGTLLCGIAMALSAQTQPSQPADLSALLGRIEETSQAALTDLKNLHIDKWKTDSSVKQQTQANVDSVERNISNALPGLVQQVRTTPASVAAQFKLYRNMNALYDVLSGVTESAGAFGTKGEFQTVSNDLSAVDNARRALADRLAVVTAQQDSEITRLRAAAQAAVVATPPPPPRKIVVDDNPAPKTPRKKKPATQASPKPAPQATQPKPSQ